MTVSRNCDNTLQDSSRWKRANSRYKFQRAQKTARAAAAKNNNDSNAVTSLPLFFHHIYFNDDSKCHNFWIGFIGNVVVLLHFMIWQLQYFLMNFEASKSLLSLGRSEAKSKVIAVSPTLRVFRSWLIFSLFSSLIEIVGASRADLATDRNTTFQYILTC